MATAQSRENRDKAREERRLKIIEWKRKKEEEKLLEDERVHAAAEAKR